MAITRTVLIMGATGATGSLLTRILLETGHRVKAVARSPQKLEYLKGQHHNLEIVQGTVLDMPDRELEGHIQDCTAVASCLGHNISLKGIYGKPRRLVRDSLIKVSECVQRLRPAKPVKLVLMNTTGNRNPDADPEVSTGHKTVIGILRALLPPHVDNEQAAEYLRTGVGTENHYVEWCAVRPDGLINETFPTRYDVYRSPTRDPLFNAGQTSRINVAHFMSELLSDTEVWEKWRGQMPVIYNSED